MRKLGAEATQQLVTNDDVGLSGTFLPPFLDFQSLNAVTIWTGNSVQGKTYIFQLFEGVGLEVPDCQFLRALARTLKLASNKLAKQTCASCRVLNLNDNEFIEVPHTDHLPALVCTWLGTLIVSFPPFDSTFDVRHKQLKSIPQRLCDKSETLVNDDEEQVCEKCECRCVGAMRSIISL